MLEAGKERGHFSPTGEAQQITPPSNVINAGSWVILHGSVLPNTPRRQSSSNPAEWWA